ncbi:transcriptional regulator [Stenotrophomonas pavanii]|uniref:transcriptional regulator n=1 Tax=Stenotrophomonas pavanii TaxID=487698 RepID=UPI0039C746DB
MNAIATAVQKHGSGQAGLARLLGVTPQAVNQWVSGNRPVPSRHVLAIESATGVSRHLLRPDVFGSADGEMPIARIGPQIDCRMSKRALRARLGLSTDKQLAKVLQLPAAQVASWPEDGELPALPQITNLLGLQERVQGVAAPQDPDESRIVNVEVA